MSILRDKDEDENGQPRVFRNFGEQLRAAMDQAKDPYTRHEKLDKCQVMMRAATGLSEQVASDGGFLVQTDFAAELLKRTYETGMLVSKVRKIGISQNANGLKMNMLDESSRANGSRYGGVQTYWENEADQITASKTKFKPVEWRLNKMVAAYYATEELLQDVPALGSVVSGFFAEEFAFKLDDAILRGDGAGKPLGILSSNALVTQTKEGSQTAATIVLNNITKMRSRLWARSRGSSVWLINQDCEPQLNILSLTVGNNSYPVLMPATGISGAPYDTMFGRPVLPIEHCETLGTKGDILLLDLSQYLLVDKGGINSAASIHVRFLFDEQCFRFTYRVGGQPMWDKTLTPFKGTATQSPFISLETRA